MRLLAVLIIVPLIEIALFIQIGSALGVLFTLFMVVSTAIIGTIFLRYQGLAILFELKRALSSGGDVTTTLLHGALICVAGLLLLTPGILTDTVGFLLLVPSFRQTLINWGIKNLASNIFVNSKYSSTGQDSDIIEGSAYKVDRDQHSNSK